MDGGRQSNAYNCFYITKTTNNMDSKDGSLGYASPEREATGKFFTKDRDAAGEALPYKQESRVQSDEVVIES